MMSDALSDQILLAIIASHFGWFNLPIKPVDSLKIIGVVLLVMSVLFINWEPNHAR